MSEILRRRDENWAVWRRLVKAFGFRRLVMHLSASTSGLGFYGVDMISGLSRTPMALEAHEVLHAVGDGQLAVLHEMARINAERNTAMWKMAALFYVTGPTSAVLLAFQLVPEFTRSVLSQGSWILAAMFVLLTVWIVVYYSIYWRAIQVQAVIELERAQRLLMGEGA